MTAPPIVQLLAIDEVARRLGIHRRTVERLISCGVLRAVHIGRRRLIAEQDLGVFVAANTPIESPRERGPK